MQSRFASLLAQSQSMDMHVRERSDVSREAFDSAWKGFERIHHHLRQEFCRGHGKLTDVRADVEHCSWRYPLSRKGGHHAIRCQRKLGPRDQRVPCWRRSQKVAYVS